MIKPAEQWREALPSGNGTVGALVYGSVNQERVLFNHNELWYEGSIGELPDVSAELPVVRQLLLDGNYREANVHYRPAWSGFLGINENLQMTYWQALPGNLQESMTGFFDYFDAHLDEFRHNATQL